MSGKISFGALARQQGAVLMVGLVIVASLTLLGVVAMQTAMMEEKIAGNQGDDDTALMAAEAALADAEAWIDSQTSYTDASADASDDWWPLGDAAVATPGDATWQSNARAYSGTISGVAAQPLYTVEEYSYSSGTAIYQATAMGFGGRAETTAILRSRFRKTFGGGPGERLTWRRLQ